MSFVFTSRAQDALILLTGAAVIVGVGYEAVTKFKPLVPLVDLSLSGGLFNGTSSSGTLVGARPGSTFSLGGTPPAGLSIAATGGTYTWTGAGSGSGIYTITETNPNGAGSPHVTTVHWSISFAGSPDTTPDAFTLTDVTNAALSTVETSNTITVSGLGTGVTVSASISGDASSQIKLNSGSWGAGPVTVGNGDTVTVRNTSSASNSTAVNTTLTIGGVSDTFTSTTVAAVAAVLSSPTASATGQTTASLGVTTNESGGTLSWVLCTSATPPTQTQVAAGQDSTGAAAAAHGSQAVSASGAQSVSATGLTASTTYYAYFMHTNASSLQSNVAASVSFATSGSGTSINAPTLALHTASGASPATWDIGGDSTFQPGMFVHQQFATNSGFTTGVVDYFTQVEGSDWEAGSDTIGNGLVSFVQPTGTYYQRVRFETAPGDSTNNVVSPWSNTQTDTITTSSAQLSATDKSPYVAVDTSYKAHISASGLNAWGDIRATIAQANQKGHFELTINHIFANIMLGITDAALNIASAFPAPGDSGNTGASLQVSLGSTAANISYNNASHAVTLSSNPADGDTIAIDHDFTAHTLHFRYHHLAGTTDDLGTITMTSLIPSTPYAIAGGRNGDGASSYDQWTFNPGNAAFVVTPDTGFTYYG